DATCASASLSGSPAPSCSSPRDVTATAPAAAASTSTDTSTTHRNPLIASLRGELGLHHHRATPLSSQASWKACRRFAEMTGWAPNVGGAVARYSGPALDRPAVLCDLLEAGLSRDPDADALICAEFTWSWRTLDRVTRRLAQSYLEMGLRPGDRIASLMPNRPRLIAHYIACFRAGLVATPLNYRYTAPEIDHALAVSGARALLVHAEREPDLDESRASRHLPLGRIGYPQPSRDGVSFDDLIDGGPTAPPPPQPDPSQPAVIFFTSGSTGPPKGVTHTHQTVGWMLAIAAAGLELSADDRLLAGSSLSHVGAFYVSFAALSVGAGLIVARSFDGDELLPLLRDGRPTVLSMLPSALFALTRDHGARGEDFASLRLCRAAGDCVSAELEREFTGLTGIVIDEAYGLTEVGLAAV